MSSVRQLSKKESQTFVDILAFFVFFFFLGFQIAQAIICNHVVLVAANANDNNVVEYALNKLGSAPQYAAVFFLFFIPLYVMIRFSVGKFIDRRDNRFAVSS